MKHLTVNNQTAVQNNFYGNGAVYHGYAGMPDADGRVYSNEQCNMEADRAGNMRLKLARTFYRWYAWEAETNTWNWENKEMTAFYHWLQRMKERNISVALNTGWWCPGDVNGTFRSEKSPFAVPGNWAASVEKYANWVSESVHQLIEVRGFTNIKILVLFTEPATYAGRPTQEDMSPYTCWYTASKAVHQALLRDNRRHLVQLMGPNEGQPAWWGAQIKFNMLRFAAQHANDFLDLYAAHTYQPVGVVPYAFLQQGRGAVNFNLPGGRIFRPVTLQPNTGYVATVCLACNRAEPQKAGGGVIFGAFLDIGQNDIYENSLPAPALAPNSLLALGAEKLTNTLQTVTFRFQTQGRVAGRFGLFYDVKGKNSVTVTRLELCTESGAPVTENGCFSQGYAGWNTFMCGGMDPYADWYNWTKIALACVPKNKGFVFDEYNVVYDRDNSRPTHGAEIATAAVAMMNAGVQASMLWSLFDQQWPNNHVTSSDSFVDGDHRCGVMPVLTRTPVPYRSFYAFTLISRYTGGPGTRVYEGFGEHRLYTTMSVAKNGDITVIVVNQKEQADEFTLHFKVPLSGAVLYRHCFDPESCRPNKTAAFIGANKKIAPVYELLCDVVPAYSVTVYTTRTD